MASCVLMHALSPDKIDELGMNIWQRECNQSIAGLTSWNPNEPFPSLGIGHFIWIPQDSISHFEQTFPELLLFLQSCDVTLPDWLSAAIPKGCPWRSRDEFMEDLESTRMMALRNLLKTTISLQATFIVDRFSKVRDKIAQVIHPRDRSKIMQRFDALSSSPKTIAAMIDYVHCKGDGTNPKERYQSTGWGLLQLLECMNDQAANLLEEFIVCAKKTLEQRVALSDPDKNEARWLAGWHKRIDGYRL